MLLGFTSLLHCCLSVHTFDLSWSGFMVELPRGRLLSGATQLLGPALHGPVAIGVYYYYYIFLTCFKCFALAGLAVSVHGQLPLCPEVGRINRTVISFFGPKTF